MVILNKLVVVVVVDHSPLFLNYKRNIQAIIKVTFRLHALIPVGYSR